MGSECTPDEREFRYLTFYQAIHDIEKDIKALDHITPLDHNLE